MAIYCLIGNFFLNFEDRLCHISTTMTHYKDTYTRFVRGSLLLLLAFLGTFHAYAGELLLTGVYHGSNLYVQNPHDGESNYCVKDIYVNGKKHMDAPQASVFTIDLSALKPNTSVKIEIYHSDGCEPKVINPNAIRVKDEFQFTFLEIDADQIHWKSRGEKKSGTYFIEKFEHNNWTTERAVDGRGESLTNEYRKPIDHHAGENKYRLKYLEPSGKSYYSEVINFKSERDKITFYPQRVSSKITFSRTTDYEIRDAYGNKVLTGRGSEVDCSSLKTGKYYLSFDNRTEQFLKK